MNIKFYLHELRRQVLSSVLWFVFLGAMIVLILMNFSAISSVTMEALLGFNFSMFTDEVRNSLQLGFLPDLSEYKEYFAFFIQLITVSVCFYASFLGVSAISSDIGEGTMEFLYAQPVSKLGILLTKLLSRITTLLVFDFALFLLSAVVSASAAPNGSVYMGSIFSVFTTAFLSHLIFLMIGFFVSSFWSSSAQSSSFSLATVLFSVLVGILAPLSKGTAWMRVLSPYHYSVPSEVIRPGYGYPLIGWVMLLLGGAALFGLAYLRFYKRDLVVR